MYDALVIGGGPAGLQAALTIGRMHRSVLLVDSGRYRNGAVEHAHNVATHDGRAPGEIRRLAREDLAAYDTVELRDTTVRSIRQEGEAFVAETDSGLVSARTVVLATGLRDDLPDVPGLAQAWGKEAAACPFCHGHELAGRAIGLMGEGPHVPVLTAMLDPIAARIVHLREDEVAEVERVPGGLLVHRTVGDPVELGGLFLHPPFAQAAPFAEQLGLELLPSGCVRVDPLGQTSRPGVLAAGDLAHVEQLPMPMASVLLAAAAGLAAGSSVVRSLAAATVASGAASGPR